MIEQVVNQIHRTTHIGHYKKAPYSEAEQSFVRLHGLSAVALLRLQYIGPETGISELVGVNPLVLEYLLSRSFSQVLHDRELPFDDISLLLTYFLSILDAKQIGHILGMDPKTISESMRCNFQLLKMRDKRMPSVMRDAQRPQELRIASIYSRLVGLQIPHAEVLALLSGCDPYSLQFVSNDPGTLRITNEILESSNFTLVNSHMSSIK